MTHYILFDGECGLCHFWVSFTVKRDREELFHYAPLQLVGEEQLRERYGDTILLVSKEDGILTRSDAALFVLKALPGIWPAIGIIGSLFPRFIRDSVYTLIAKVRKKIFPTPKELCPLVPEELSSRFLTEGSSGELQELVAGILQDS